MAVTVRTTRTSAGNHIKVTHAEANHIDIANGHLLVLKWNGGGYDTIAAYAPEKWIDATTEQSAAK
ncbi:hypothetical protein [Blastococcus sp. TF02A-30]|uniref:hypothetical protein n=1 Tax=Blastococcus sp. TF02A-30 TaxID=2250580 RepID=UPI000DEB4DC7|nr:hypothetical protein [Blastococcus sp. TF02A-30]RBY86379.1 hypothetical protein DQ241_12570 [Blastococcus sp. TF02A-30]